MFKICLTFCLILISFGQISCVLNPKVVCYYEYWYAYHTDNGKMTSDQIDNSLCTHIVYGYLSVEKSGELMLTDPDFQSATGWAHDLEKFAKNKGKSKAMVSIGGFSQSANFSAVVSQESSRALFVESVVTFLKKYDFDGITIDWSTNTWLSDDLSGFTKLLYKLFTEFNEKYTLGIALAARAQNFDIKKVDPYVDFITVQTLDYQGNWNHEVGFAAPLDMQIQNMNEWFNAGATITKLLMTIPFYDHTWILEDPSKTEPGAKASSPGAQGDWTKAPGKLSYNELCTKIKGGGWDLHQVTAKASIYGVDPKTHTWVSFEDKNTCNQKTKNATTEGFGGVVVQALNNDDYRGLCGEKYPLLRGVNDGLNKDPVHVRTIPPFVSTTEVIVTADPNLICHKEGTFRDPKDCNVYHTCIEYFPGVLTDEKHNCASGEAFDESDGKCKDKSKVPGCH